MAASEWQTIEVEAKEEHRTHLSYFCDPPQNGMDLFSTDVARARTASDTTSEAAATPRGKQREKSGGESEGGAQNLQQENFLLRHILPGVADAGFSHIHPECTFLTEL